MTSLGSLTMPSTLSFSFSSFHFFFFLFFCVLSCENKLVHNFYAKSCPQAEKIIRNITWTYARDPANAAKLLKVQFNDCFVKGCDASILLLAGDGRSEYDDDSGMSVWPVRYVYYKTKKQLEKHCPDTVSCADIIALVARDAVSYQFRKSLWEVPTGRRDGGHTTDVDAERNMPDPYQNFTQLEHIFANKGLSIRDIVVLSGAHTIGEASCYSLYERFEDKHPRFLNVTHTKELKRMCKPSQYDYDHGIQITVVLDPITPDKFDNNYYKLLKQNLSIFTTDAVLLQDEQAKSIVEELVASNEVFLKEFGKSMVKMGSIGVLTGKDGEIRKHCNMIINKNN